MNDNGDDLEDYGHTEEEIVEPESDSENDAIIHEKKDSSLPRDNI